MLADILKKIDESATTKGPKIVKLTTRTRPKLLKKGRISGKPCPFDFVERFAERLGIIGCGYESSVNRQQTRETGEGTFNASQLWKGKGQHVVGDQYLVEHIETGERYLVFKPHNVDGKAQIKADVWYNPATGEEINPLELAEWLPPAYSQAENQGVDKEVFWRTISVDNVVAIKYGEEHYVDPLHAMKG